MKDYLALDRQAGSALWFAGAALGAFLLLPIIVYGVCIPTNAMAKVAKSARAAQERAELKTKAKKGYDLSLTISNKSATIVASKGHMAAIYSTQQSHIGDNSYKASFGKFGEVDVRFESSSRHSAPCARRGSRFGRFTGIVKFRGERNFTEISTKTVSGIVVNSGCKGIGGNRKGIVRRSGNPNSQPSLQAVTFENGSVVQFRAGRGAIRAISGWESKVGIPLGLNELERRPIGFSAIGLEHEGGIRIVRLAAAGAPETAFLISSEETLITTPSAPFTGVGRMNICHPGSWHGDIKVKFPGSERQLAGPRTLAVVKPSPAICA